MRKFYTGIGARKTPRETCDYMTSLGRILEERGWTLRSGHAEGADQAFAKDVQREADIWLPWEKFNIQDRNPNHRYRIGVDEESLATVDKYHPRGGALSETGRKLMSRNYRQLVGGGSGAKSSFVICWTADGEASGGTGQALRMAEDFGIPVFNLRRIEAQGELARFL